MALSKMETTFKIGDAQYSARTIDANGYLRIAKCPISSWGIFVFGRCQLEEDSDSTEAVNVYRPIQTLADPAMAASAQNVPLIDDHTHLEGHQQDSSDPQGVAPEQKGVAGTLSNVVWDPEYTHEGVTGWMLGDVTVFSRTMQNQIDAGKRDVSLGYTSKITKEPGTSNGVPYEYVQTNMLVNHIALVDEPRVKGARLLDDNSLFNQLDEETAMRKGMDASSVEKLKALLPALQQFLSEEAQEPQHQEEAAPAEGVADEQGEVAAPAPTETKMEQDGDDELAQVIEALKGIVAKLEAECPGEAAPTQDELDAEVKPEEGVEAEVKPAGDSLRAFYADSAKKDKLYGRVSRIIGAFDHSEMTAASLASYSARKLGLKCGDAAALTAVENFLEGAERAAKATAAQVRTHGDSAAPKLSNEMDDYLSGK